MRSTSDGMLPPRLWVIIVRFGYFDRKSVRQKVSMLDEMRDCMSSVPMRKRRLSERSGCGASASLGSRPECARITAWRRSAASSSGVIFSARFAVRKASPGTMQPTMPGSDMARSNSAIAASIEPTGMAANALRRSGYLTQAAEIASL